VRIAISTWTRRLAGGVESYLAAVIPALADRGHDLALIHEVDEPLDRGPLHARAEIAEWCLADGAGAAIERLRRWRPDVIFAHGLEDETLETRIASVAPTVLFAHAYRGTCISGTKTFTSPEYQSCERVLGLACLAHYLPRGCGGRSPATMMQLYRRESARRDGLGRFEAVMAFSQHIASEYERHGVAPTRIHRVPCHITAPAAVTAKHLPADGPLRLLFVGRMEALKGGDVLIDAIPEVQSALRRPLRVTFVGDGRARGDWEARSREVATTMGVGIDFTGWLTPAERDRLFIGAQLLVVPSRWPEPFGLVGLEAAGYGMPSAAFALGGIGEWLKDGTSGALAVANPPTAPALTEAIVRCLANPEHYVELSRGALAIAAQHSMAGHLSALTGILAAAAATERVHA
jgi:glycosyltransferase involved in cell wall biosynthesis